MTPKLEEIAAMFAATPQILIVEDDPGVRAYLLRLLSKSGAQVTCVGNVEGVEAALNSRFDLIVLDLVIPGISKTQLLRVVGEKTKCPVIIFSGNLMSDSVSSAISLLNRPIWFIEKPATFSQCDVRRMFDMLSIGSSFGAQAQG